MARRLPTRRSAEKAPAAVIRWKGVDLPFAGALVRVSPLRAVLEADLDRGAIAERVQRPFQGDAAGCAHGAGVSTRGGLNAGSTLVSFRTIGFGHLLLSCSRWANMARTCRPSVSCFQVVFGTTLLYS